jgi:Flp pilus assembly protein TadD
LLPTDNKDNGNNILNRNTSINSLESFSNKPVPELTVNNAVNLAFSHYDSGNLSEAEQLCRLVLQEIPHHIDALQLLGIILKQKGQYDEAAQCLHKAIEQAPGHASLHNNLAMVLHKLDKLHEAVSEFNKAIVIQPDFAKAYNNLGVTLMKLGRIIEAINAFRQAIQLQDDLKEAYNNIGLALKKNGDIESAVTSYKKAISFDPKYAAALSNLGMALVSQGKFKEAADYLQKAVTLFPNSAEFRNNLGILFNRQEHYEEAVAESKKAITIYPDYAEAHNNLGTALIELGQFSHANVAFERAIAIDPQCAQAHHNRSLVLLLTSQFEQGWKEYQWRWRNDGFSTPLRPFSQPWWDGSSENLTKLLVWAEQGIGDEVQFSGLIRHIISKNIDIIIECDQRLLPLIQRSFPGKTVIGRTEPPNLLLKDPSITHQIPMASIPGVLKLSPDSMPYQDTFMIPDKTLRENLRSEYKKDGNPVLIGISFRSGNSQEGRKRSIALEQWAPIFKATGGRFVNLQYGECSKQLQQVHDLFGVKIINDQRIDPLKNLDSFAAQVAAMDLVISVDNSTVHFAGALGVEVWTMLPCVPDWRWGLEGETTRWYSTMRLFRQQERGNWEHVISRVAEKLSSFIDSHKKQ